QGKYLTLRPRPAEMGPGFPYPDDATGDVKNLLGAPGGNDSYWIDLGLPVETLSDGTKYKPLFAALIVDLDNRININASGNIRGQSNGHASNQCWGLWEMSLAQVLNQGGNEWTKLFVGNGTVQGRYGPDGQPSTTGGVGTAGVSPHFYGQVDYDGCNEAA